MSEPASKTQAVSSLAKLFLRLGFTAFGGPAAHIALMEDEVVRRRGWLSPQEFLDLVGAANLIPGPTSTELAIHIGYRRGGWLGLLVAGSCFILPAVLIVMGVGWAYVRFGRLPQAEALLYGIKPVIIAIVAQALWRLGRAALKTVPLGVAAAIATALSFSGVNELVLLFGTAATIMAWNTGLKRGVRAQFAMPWLVAAAAQTGVPAVSATAVGFGLAPLFWFFVKVGSVLFGSGYVLLAFLRADLVERWHWLDEAQLLDAIAVGQITPGPVFTTATFIGYLLGGAPGAIVATLGIFLPAFFFVAVSSPWIPRLRQSRAASAFLDGVNAASVALIMVVTWQLSRAALVDALTLGLAGGSLAVLLRWRVNSSWLIAAGALIGLIKLLAAGA